MKPDVLAVHDPAAGLGAPGKVPVVLAGHVHRRSWKEVDGTLALTVGSTGATPLRGSPSTPKHVYEAAVLYFDGSHLVAVDNVALRGTSGEFRIDRRLAPGRADAAP